MRQRNNTGQPLTIHTDPPQVLAPDETVDHDTYIVGLTVVDEPTEQPPDRAAEPAPLKTSKASGKETSK